MSSYDPSAVSRDELDDGPGITRPCGEVAFSFFEEQGELAAGSFIHDSMPVFPAHYAHTEILKRILGAAVSRHRR
jgi:hypothetical protein